MRTEDAGSNLLVLVAADFEEEVDVDELLAAGTQHQMAHQVDGQRHRRRIGHQLA